MPSNKKLMDIGVMVAFSVYWWLLGFWWDASWQAIGLALAGILCCSAYLYLSLHNPDIFETIFEAEPCECEEVTHLFFDPDEMAACEICGLPVKKIDAHIGKVFDAQTGFAGRWVFTHHTCRQKELEEREEYKS